MKIIKFRENWKFDLTNIPQGDYIPPPYQIKCELGGNYPVITMDTKYPPYPPSIDLVLEEDDSGQLKLTRIYPSSVPQK